MVSMTQRRTRLAPEARRSQLLDTARTLIQQAGLQGFTMEGLARSASVSTPLVYNYFATRMDLLRELLEREYRKYGEQLRDQLRDAQGFEQIARIFVGANFDHHAPGNILPILLSQPELAVATREQEKTENRRTARYLVQSITKSYPLTRSQAELLVSMSSGASIAAAGYCARSKAGREETIDAVMQYMVAGIRSFSED